jgi:hypothetical protein
MHFSLVFGIFLLGCGLGSLVTAALYFPQLKKLKSDLHTDHRPAGLRNNIRSSSDAHNGEREERSA